MNKRLALGIIIGIAGGILGALLTFYSGGYLAALGLGLLFGGVVGLSSVVVVLIVSFFKKRK